MKIRLPVILAWLICALAVVPANAGLILEFSTTNDANSTTSAISGNVGDQFTVSVFVRGTGSDANVLTVRGLVTFGIEGSYNNTSVIAPTATPITRALPWVANPLDPSDPNTFGGGQFFLAGLSEQNMLIPVKTLVPGDPIRLGQFQFQINSLGTSNFLFDKDSEDEYLWMDGEGDPLVAPTASLSVTGVPEPGAFGILATVGLASFVRRRKRNLV